jgi:hypothetical protein
MEPHEILAEIRKDCPVNPFPYLLNHPNSIKGLRDYYGESHNGADCWYLIDLIDNLLLSKLHIGLFVAAKDGKPLEKPSKFFACNAKEAALILDYTRAQRHVIFERWEVSQNKDDDNFIYIENKELDIEIEFDTSDGAIEILIDKRRTSFFAPLEIKTIADLADATTENPLKLK